jgi:hypothetical protein
MNDLLRLVAVIGAIALVICGLNEVQPNWLTEIGPALFNLSESRSHLKRENHNALRLDEKNQRALSYFAAKEQVIRDVVAGHLSLCEAAARFRDLHQSSPLCDMSSFRQFVPGDSDEDRYCRQVIRAVESYGPSGSDKVDRVRRLQKEFEEASACGRAICLP